MLGFPTLYKKSLKNNMYFYVSTNILKAPHFLAQHLGSSMMFVICFSSSQNAPVALPSSNFFSPVSLLGCPYSVQSLAIALGMWLKLSQSQIKVFSFLTVTHRTNHLRSNALSWQTLFLYTLRTLCIYLLYLFNIFVLVMDMAATCDCASCAMHADAQLSVSGDWSLV